MCSPQKPAFDYSGSSFDSFLDEEGLRTEVEVAALQRVFCNQQAAEYVAARGETI